MPIASSLHSLLVWVGRASDRVRRALTIALLVAVYVLVLPWYWLGLRLGRRRPQGWRVRNDAGAGTLERLRRPF